MKRRLLLLLFLLITPGLSYATPMGDAIREIDKAFFRVVVFCEYSLKLKDNAPSPLNIIWGQEGNGFFIPQTDRLHLALTLKHIVRCDASQEEVYPDISADKVLSFKALTSIKINIGSRYFKADIADYAVNEKPEIDFALLEIALPASVSHGHLRFLTDESEYDMGSEVMVRGFMPCEDPQLCDADGWVKRLKFANIEGLTKDKIFIQLNTPAYSGMSGSPVLFLKNGKYYVIGIFAIAYVSQRFGTIDISWSTRLKKEYFYPKK